MIRLNSRSPEVMAPRILVHTELCVGSDAARGRVSSKWHPLNRQLVVKLLQNHCQESTQWLASGASVVNSLPHPNIVPCDSFIITEDWCFLVMPFVDGSNLCTIVQHELQSL